MNTGDANDRVELARTIRENVDEIAARMERCYVEQYPQSRANQMSSHSIHGWTLSEIDSIAAAIEANDVESRPFESIVGDQLVDPNNAELSPFVNYLSCVHFEARVIAPVVYVSLLSDPPHARRLVSCFEEFIQNSIAWNCKRYTEQISQPHALMRTWNLMDCIEPCSSLEDTPANRYKLDLENEPPELHTMAALTFDALSARETQVLELIVAGKGNGEIASELGIRQNTVKNHVAHIFDKFNVNSRVELVSRVLQG